MKELFKYLKWRVFDNGKYSYWGKIDEPKVWKVKGRIKGKASRLSKYYFEEKTKVAATEGKKE